MLTLCELMLIKLAHEIGIDAALAELEAEQKRVREALAEAGYDVEPRLRLVGGSRR